MHISLPTDLDARDLRVGLVVSRYHEEITRAMADAAVATFGAAGGDDANLLVVDAPGTFELTVCCQAFAERDDINGIVALGCVIRGETTHDQHLARAVAIGLTELTLATGTPISFGVLTCQTMHQARARAGGDTGGTEGRKGNKGAEAMAATLLAVHAVRSIHAVPEPH